MPGLTLTLADDECEGGGEASAGPCVEVGVAGATFAEALSLGVEDDEAADEASPELGEREGVAEASEEAAGVDAAGDGRVPGDVLLDDVGE